MGVFYLYETDVKIYDFFIIYLLTSHRWTILITVILIAKSTQKSTTGAKSSDALILFVAAGYHFTGPFSFASRRFHRFARYRILYSFAGGMTICMVIL